MNGEKKYFAVLDCNRGNTFFFATWASLMSFVEEKENWEKSFSTLVKLINLTPHTLNIYNQDGIETTYPRTEVSEGRFLVLRVDSISTVVDVVDSFTVTRTVYGNIKLVTADEHGKNELPFEGIVPTADYYIVSMMCLAALKDCTFNETKCLAPPRIA